jgi:hypothetical protein
VVSWCSMCICSTWISMGMGSRRSCHCTWRQVKKVVQWNLWITSQLNEGIYEMTPYLIRNCSFSSKCKSNPKMRTPLNKGHFQLVPRLSLFQISLSYL